MRRVGLVCAWGEGEAGQVSKILGLFGKPEGVDGTRVAHDLAGRRKRALQGHFGEF